jgi:hypothetical protein
MSPVIWSCNAQLGSVPDTKAKTGQAHETMCSLVGECRTLLLDALCLKPAQEGHDHSTQHRARRTRRFKTQALTVPPAA